MQNIHVKLTINSIDSKAPKALSPSFPNCPRILVHKLTPGIKLHELAVKYTGNVLPLAQSDTAGYTALGRTAG